MKIMEKEILEIENQVAAALDQLVEVGNLKAGALVVIGCSTSEVAGGIIGKNGSLEVAEAIFKGAKKSLEPKGINFCAQCCEHLNRAIVTERKTVPGREIVAVVPKMHAGGSFATVTYKNMSDPVVLEEISADAGIDIGSTLIGMHLKRVAVPVRLNIKNVGNAHLTAAYTRPKFIGGERAEYK